MSNAAPLTGPAARRYGPDTWRPRETSASTDVRGAAVRPAGRPVQRRNVPAPRRGATRSGARVLSAPRQRQVFHVAQPGRVLEGLMARLDPVLGDPLVPLAEGDA